MLFVLFILSLFFMQRVTFRKSHIELELAFLFRKKIPYHDIYSGKYTWKYLGVVRRRSYFVFSYCVEGRKTSREWNLRCHSGHADEIFMLLEKYCPHVKLIDEIRGGRV